MMDFAEGTAVLGVLVGIGVLSGLTTVLFGFGGGFVAVPVMAWVDRGLGPAAMTVAIGTSAAVMLVNAAVATAATPRATLRRLHGTGWLLPLLAFGGAAGALLGMRLPSEVVRWGFVAYLALTLADVLLRPGFLRPSVAVGTDVSPSARARLGIPGVAAFPIGALAAALGVGGSVMTVPLLRRSGAPMAVAAALANPLTLVISAPALLMFLTVGSGAALSTGHTWGAVDPAAAAALLLGAVPVIVRLRRHPPRIPDRVHAIAYPGLLVVAAVAMLCGA